MEDCVADQKLVEQHMGSVGPTSWIRYNDDCVTIPLTEEFAKRVA